MVRSVFVFTCFLCCIGILQAETPVTVTFHNQLSRSVEVLWVDAAGIERGFGTLEAGQTREQGSYPGQVWHFKQGENAVGTYEATKEAHQRFEILLRSKQSNTAVAVKFRNGTYKPVDLIWVDPSGKEKGFGTLFPGEERVESTFATHVWRFRQGEKDAGIYTITEESGQEYTARSDTKFDEAPEPGEASVEDPIHSVRHWDAPMVNDTTHRYSYAVTVESMECTAIDRNEPGSENEIFGKLWVNFVVRNTKPPTLPEIVWEADSKNPVSLGKGKTSEINKKVKVGSLTASERETAYVVVQGELWEKDTKWGPFGGSDNDNLGKRSSREIPLRDVKEKGSHTVRFREGRDEITVHFSVEAIR